MMDAERFLLKWNNHQSNLVTVFDQLYEQEAFTDVTLACDGRSFAAHKVILSACSPYFQQLFLSNPCKHPIIFMRDVRAADLDALLAFMYRGEINVHQQDLASFLKTAESLQIKGLSDSSDKPRDTSKILEAMERKFSSTSGVTSSNCLGLGGGIGNLISNAYSRSSPVSNAVSSITSAAGMNALSRSFMSHVNANHALDASSPPEKKFKPTPEEFTRILPKIKSLVNSQSLMSPVPGLITPITLATTIMKSGVHPSSIPLPYLPALENNNSLSLNADSSSPAKEKKKDGDSSELEKDPLSSEEKNSFVEGYISGDAPHPVYLVSSVGGLGLNSSGNSTPSHDVKVEEEDPLEENAFSDEPGSLGPNDNLDDHASLNFDSFEDSQIVKTEAENSEIDIKFEPLIEFVPQESNVEQTSIPVDVLRTYLFDNTRIKKEDVDSPELKSIESCSGVNKSKQIRNNDIIDVNNLDSDTSLNEVSIVPPYKNNAGSLANEIIQRNASETSDVFRKYFQCINKSAFQVEELNLVASAMSTMESLGENLHKNPEFMNCLLQEIKIKVVQERLQRERPVEMIGLKDHTYMMPLTAKKNANSPISWHECRFCDKRFPPNRRHRYLSHLRTHTGEKPHKCNLCQKRFNRRDHLVVHSRLHNGDKPFSCDSCRASFSHKVSLTNHKCKGAKA